MRIKSSYGLWRGRSVGSSLRSLAVIALFGVRCDPLNQQGIRQDVFECEEAVQHAKNCCGGKSLTVSCIYHDGCGLSDGSSAKSYSLIGVPTSYAVMLRKASCDELRASGFCDNPQQNLDHAGRDAGIDAASSDRDMGQMGHDL